MGEKYEAEKNHGFNYHPLLGFLCNGPRVTYCQGRVGRTYRYLACYRPKDRLDNFTNYTFH
jgi:hypothetical protein